MDLEKYNVIKYSDLEFNKVSQSIGIFVNNDSDELNDKLISLLNIFQNFDAVPIIISESELDDVKKDFLNDCFLFDIIIINEIYFDFNFLEILINKSNLFGVNVIYNFDNFDLKLLDESKSEKYLISHANQVIVNDFETKNVLGKFNNNISVISKLVNLDEDSSKDNNQNLTKWLDVINLSKRNKDSLLYKYFKLFIEKDYNMSFQDFLIENSYDIIVESNQFDHDWYLSKYPDVKQLNSDPIFHYLSLGVYEGCLPNQYFNSNLIFKGGKLDPFVSFILYENMDKSDDYFLIKSSGLFDEDWYLSQYPDISTDPIMHFLEIGSSNHYNPSKDFDISWYLEKYVDVQNLNINPFVHYIKYGQYEDRFPNRFSYYESNIVDKKDVNQNMEILRESGLFDEELYLEKYADVKNSRFGGLEHYVKYGYNETYRSPDGYFSNTFYKNSYLTGKDENWNPLTHYALIGQFKNNKVDVFDINYKDFSYNQLKRILDVFKRQISIVIFLLGEPGKNLKRCIESLRKNTNLNYNLYIINYTPFDVNWISSDISVFDYNSSNFSNDIKQNIINSNNDIFFLTEYTEVTYKWLEKLIIKAYSDGDIDIVTPISNCIDILPEKYNSLIDPKNLTVDGLSKLIERISLSTYVEVPFINLSGVYVKNKVVSLSDFNSSSFAFNSIENLFGWIMDSSLLNVLDDSTYIYFNHDFFDNLLDKFSNNEKGWALSPLINEMMDSENIEKISSNIEYSITYVSNKRLSNRILLILNQNDLMFYNDILTLYNKDYFEFYFLTVDLEKISLYKTYKNEFIKLKEWHINHNVDSIKKTFVQNIYFNIIASLNIDAIQVNNLNYHLDGLTDIVSLLKLPLIYECDETFENNFSDEDLTKFKSSVDYDDINNDLLTNSNKVVIIGEKLKNTLKNDGFLINENNTVILNFSHLTRIQSKLMDYKNNENVKIFIPGNFNDFSDNHELIRYVDNDDFPIEFHFLGNTPYLNGCGFNHGEFTKKSLKQTVKDILPDFIGIFTIFDNIFDVIDISTEEKIPLILSEEELLMNMVDGLDGLNFINGKNVKSLLESVMELISFNNYYKNIEKLYLDDKFFKNEVVAFNKFHEDLYLGYGDSSKKIIINKPHVDKPKDNYKELFPNFAGFLANSYVSPMFEAKFTEEYKECFAVMDNVSKFLINQVKKVNDKPLVSIIMPVYNRADVILNAIDSVLNQSYENFELIIIDDCSTDNTVDILRTLDDERISIIIREQNGGASSARNTGLKQAKGDFVAYLDSDNDWDSKYLESMVGALLYLPDADAIYSGQLLYDEYGSAPFAVRFGTYNKSLLLNHNYIDLNCFCHKLSIFKEIGGFDSELYRLEDWDFILRISNNFKMYSIPILLSKYYYGNADNRISDLSIEFLNYTDLIHERNKMPSRNMDFKLNKKVNIIIPNYESLKDLRECVDAILSFDLDLVKVIIVDNDSNDAVKYYLNTLKSNKKIDVLLNEFNYGFTYAVNQGIEMSEPDADILLLNNDAILTEGAIQSMQKYAYSLDGCGIVVPQQVLPGETPTLNVHVPYASSIHECDVNPSQHHQNIINVPLFHNGEILELNFAPFFCTYIKRAVLDESVGLDAELGRHYRSDRIYSDYVRDVMGLKIYHTSDAIVYHKLQRSTAKLRESKKDFDIMFVKNQWEPELMDKLGYKKALWDD